MAPRLASKIALLVLLAACGKSKNAEKLEQREAIDKMKPTIAVTPVKPDAICVTKGQLDKGSVGVPTFRAVALGTSGDASALEFLYHGQSQETRALASGQLRRQIGLKLRAANGCNLVYVMWRLDPKPFLEISIKVNPGMRTHEECGANGYTKIKKSTYHTAVPALLAGEKHTLQAEIVGTELFAWIDGALAWRGDLPDEAKAMSGPSGFRSDNLAYDVTTFSAPQGDTSAETPHCVAPDEGD